MRALESNLSLQQVKIGAEGELKLCRNMVEACLYSRFRSKLSELLDSDNKENKVLKLLKSVVIPSLALIVGLGAGILVTTSAQDTGKVFELRIYTSTPGNLDNLHARFRDHTSRIFDKHGMKVVGYWSPTSEEEADDTLVYMLEHASREAAGTSWRAFGQDPEWQEVAAASNADGPILGGIESRYMTATDYSPMK